MRRRKRDAAGSTTPTISGEQVKRISPLRFVLITAVALAGSDGAAQGIGSVALMELILFPDRYEKEVRVEVVGYLVKEGGLQLFMSRDLAEGHDFASSIHVGDSATGEITFSTCEGYVRIRGSAMVMGPGEGVTLGKIESIKSVSTNEICWER